MKLISLTDFVLEIDENGNFIRTIDEIQRYAKILQTELELPMFLPNEGDNPTIRFKNVSFVTVKNQGVIRFYSVGNTQVFNLLEDGTHLYLHHYTLESLLTEYDESIEFELLNNETWA